jgi:hypothetical protein
MSCKNNIEGGASQETGQVYRLPMPEVWTGPPPWFREQTAIGWEFFAIIRTLAPSAALFNKNRLLVSSNQIVSLYRFFHPKSELHFPKNDFRSEVFDVLPHHATEW